MVRHGTKRTFALHRGDVARLASYLDARRPARRRDDEITLSEASRRIGGRKPSLVALWRRMEETLLAGNAVVDGERTVRVRMAAPAKGPPRAVLHESEVAWMRGLLGDGAIRTVEAGSDWLTMTYAAYEMRITPSHGRFSELWAGLRAAAETGGTPSLGDAPVRYAWVRNKSKVAFGVARDELPRLRRALGIDGVLSATPEGYLSFTQACTEMGAAPHARDLRAVLSRIEAAVAAGDPFSHGGEEGRVVQARSGTRTAIYLSPEACRLVAKATRRSWRGESFGLPPQGPDWLARATVARALGANPSTDRGFIAAWKSLVRRLEEGIPPEVNGTTCAFEWRRGVSAAHACLHVSSLQGFAASIGKRVRHPPDCRSARTVREGCVGAFVA